MLWWWQEEDWWGRIGDRWETLSLSLSQIQRFWIKRNEKVVVGECSDWITPSWRWRSGSQWVESMEPSTFLFFSLSLFLFILCLFLYLHPSFLFFFTTFFSRLKTVTALFNASWSSSSSLFSFHHKHSLTSSSNLLATRRLSFPLSLYSLVPL